MRSGLYPIFVGLVCGVATIAVSGLFQASAAFAEPPSPKSVSSPTVLKQSILEIFANSESDAAVAETPVDPIGFELGSLEYLDSENRTESSKSLQSKKVIVYFWSMYCRGCIKPLKELEAVRSALGENGVEVVTVHLFESDKSRIINRLAQMSLGLPVLFGANDVRELFEVRVLPTALALDDKHRVVARFDGGFDSNGISLKLTKQIEK